MVKRNLWLDLFKIFLSFLVICIHFVGETYTHHPLYRIAVPMFFMISGYFLYSKDQEVLKEKAIIFIKRSLKYLLIGFSIYIVYDFIMFLINGNDLGYYFTIIFYEKFLFEFFFLNRPLGYYGYQLWFLVASFTLSLIHFTLLKFNKLKWYYILIPCCFIVYLFFQGYMYLIDEETYLHIRYTRNAWFMGIPMFGLGFCSAKYDLHKKSWYKYVYLLLGVIFFLLQIYESKIVVVEMYISTVLSSFFIFQFFMGLKPIKCDWYYKMFGKSLSFYIYIFHVAVGVSLGMLFDFPNLYLKSTVVLIVSILIYEIFYLTSKIIKKNQIKN